MRGFLQEPPARGQGGSYLERSRKGEGGASLEKRPPGPAAVRPSQWRGWWTVHVSGRVAAPGVGGRRVPTPASEATTFGQRACGGLGGYGVWVGGSAATTAELVGVESGRPLSQVFLPPPPSQPNGKTSTDPSVGV